MTVEPIPAAAPRRIVIVDADHRVRRDLAGLVALGPGLEVVGTTGSAGGALELVEAHQPDVVILDPRLPDVDVGLALIARLRDRAPQVRLVVVSGAGAVEDPAFARGAHAFVVKNGRPAAILEAISGEPGASVP